MSFAEENSGSRGWRKVPGATRAIKFIGGRSILRTSEAEVKIKRINGHETSFVALGKLQTSANETADGILQRIVHAIIPSRIEESDSQIPRGGEEKAMNSSVSFTKENLPVLSKEGLQQLTEIKQRAALRKARRLDNEKSEASIQPNNKNENKKSININSHKGKLIKIS